MKHLKIFFKRVFILLFLLILMAISVLFGTDYGRELRITAAGSILTSQHPQYARYTFLSQNELDKLLDSINNPKWSNSDEKVYKKIAEKQLKELKNKPLKIEVESIKSDANSRFHFEGKLVTVSNPFNIKLVTHKGTQGKDKGEKISVMAKRNDALFAVNASGFADETGRGGGNVATGIVIEDGEIIDTGHDKDTPAIISGLNKFGEMITGNYSPNQLLDKQIISAAGFMPQLIVNGEKMITKGDGGWGSGPRSIMAQKKDGSIMFLVIDGRQAHSIGATLKECQDILYEKGAINAMAMDGGSSATLYFGGKVRNSPSTLSHQDRFLPNAWVIAPNLKQKVEIKIDGKSIDTNSLKDLD
ncbi:phosphodiester glycosidase family protein [Bacillus thuringiensis]|uniref:Phosphodiester glycosidase family protein n=1 Tax=Bacillus thuringiensis TaxID=1428 RepID=A0AAW9GLD9_BACTU|nr:phosphodiester glycosidase family protein [Bacillus thuringiensis]MDY0854365.1 phosphodiester glycosidase family protein [Bacillus thuringiensis]MDY4393645.1 phosphodiester glycosidase family protein [Bacillus thuringiensis]